MAIEHKRLRTVLSVLELKGLLREILINKPYLFEQLAREQYEVDRLKFSVIEDGGKRRRRLRTTSHARQEPSS